MYRPIMKKLSNRNRILECIFRRAPIARTEIADDTEITPATVTQTVTGLIGEQLVKEIGEASSDDNSSGRKRILIDLISDSGYSLGVEFTQKALVTCLTDLRGNLVLENTVPFTQELADTITEAIITQVNHLLMEADIDTKKLVGIGIAVPGHMDIHQNKLITNHTLWNSFQPKLIRDAFDYPIIFENNARCMALGQYLFHPSGTPENFSFFHIGMGMFCANLVDGELFLGNNYVSGEIGHTIVNADGQHCECGKYGCLQTIASERWLLRYAQLLYENHPGTLLRCLAPDKASITIHHITTAYSMGDPIIGSYISEALKYLGISTSNVAILMNPSKIFLHGAIFNNDDIRKELMNMIEMQLRFVDSLYLNTVEILPYELTDGAVGASALSVFHHFIRKNPNEI